MWAECVIQHVCLQWQFELYSKAGKQRNEELCVFNTFILLNMVLYEMTGHPLSLYTQFCSVIILIFMGKSYFHALNSTK